MMDKILLEKYGPFMDLQELADLLRLKKTSVYQQIYQGQLDIPHLKRGKKYLFPTEQTAEYLQSQMQ
jgi:excisionase family DNA binding protein